MYLSCFLCVLQLCQQMLNSGSFIPSQGRWQRWWGGWRFYSPPSKTLNHKQRYSRETTLNTSNELKDSVVVQYTAVSIFLGGPQVSWQLKKHFSCALVLHESLNPLFVFLGCRRTIALSERSRLFWCAFLSVFWPVLMNEWLYEGDNTR